jgi:hypothetical protein
MDLSVALRFELPQLVLQLRDLRGRLQQPRMRPRGYLFRDVCKSCFYVISHESFNSSS